MGISKTSDYIEINIKMTKSSQEPQVSSKSLNEDLKDMEIMLTLKIKIELKNKMIGIPKTSDHIETR